VFSQTYNTPSDGKHIIVKSCKGRVTDAGGNLKYPNNTNGSITIFPDVKGKQIKLEFDTLDIMMIDTMLLLNGSDLKMESIIAKPSWLFGDTKLFYGDEKKGSITVKHQSTNNPFGKAGFSAMISCIDKKVSFDLVAEKFTVSKKSFPENYVSLYILITAQKEKAPAFKGHIYYSKDIILDQTDIFAGDIFVDNLSTTPMNVNIDQPIPSNLSKGNYYVICVLDPQNYISETNELNNIIVSKEFVLE
jgi:hypothetical protein